MSFNDCIEFDDVYSFELRLMTMQLLTWDWVRSSLPRWLFLRRPVHRVIKCTKWCSDNLCIHFLFLPQQIHRKFTVLHNKRYRNFGRNTQSLSSRYIIIIYQNGADLNLNLCLFSLDLTSKLKLDLKLLRDKVWNDNLHGSCSSITF